MQIHPSSLLPLILLLGFAGISDGREWSSTNGAYKLEAELIAFDEDTVVLKPERGKLISAQLEELSKADRDFVQSKADQPSDDPEMHTWTSKKGMKFRGRVQAYGKKQMDVQRQLGKVWIDNQPFTKLEPLKQKIVLESLSHLEGQEFDEPQLTRWSRTLGTEVKSYPLSGVLMQLESGDVIGIPFFLFSKEDVAVLEPGWKNWLANAEDEEAREREDLHVQAQAEEYQRDRQQSQQIEMLKLEMLARARGFLRVWEVQLEPAGGTGYPLRVLVPAHDSSIASDMARQKYPGYQVTAVKRSRELLSTSQ